VVASKMIALILSLGMDTLMMSISLGMVKTKGRLKIALAFASAEAIMPLVGLFIGKGAERFIGPWASLLGGFALLAIAVWLIFFAEEGEEEEKLDGNLVGFALVITALSISVDELAVGFSIGFVGVPIVLTIVLIALQAFAFTLAGLTFGSQMKRYLGEWAEKLAGVVLGLLGIWILIDAIVHMVRH
jgi:manganese efflux pump family protein